MKTNFSLLLALLLAGAGIHSAHAAPGDLDLTFNGTGKRTTAIGSGDDIGQSVALQPDGKILLGGYTNVSAPTDNFAIVRFTATAGGTKVIVATSDLAQPLASWTVLGPATESPAGVFQFDDTQADSFARRFYRVIEP